MKTISTNCNKKMNLSIWTEVENKCGIFIKPEIKEFIEHNAGGFPIKNVIISNGEEYEIRVFLSLDENDVHYYIGEQLESFLGRTSGKIIPFAIDSEDNYYCINNETGMIYYYSSEIDEYYCIADSINSFVSLFL